MAADGSVHYEITGDSSRLVASGDAGKRSLDGLSGAVDPLKTRMDALRAKLDGFSASTRTVTTSSSQLSGGLRNVSAAATQSTSALGGIAQAAVLIGGPILAAKLLVSEVGRLSKSKYLTSGQASEIKALKNGMDAVGDSIKRAVDQASAGAILKVGNFVTGGQVTRNASIIRAGELDGKRALVDQERLGVAEKLRDQSATPEQTRARLQQDIAERSAKVSKLEGSRGGSRENVAATDLSISKQMLQMEEDLLELRDVEKKLAEETAAIQKKAADEAQAAAKKREEQLGKVRDLEEDISAKVAEAKGTKKGTNEARDIRENAAARKMSADLGIPQDQALKAIQANRMLDDKIKSNEEGERAGRKHSAFDGKRSKIHGYSGAQRDARPKTIFDRTFNEFFNPEETAFGKRSDKSGFDQTFNEFFGKTKPALSEKQKARISGVPALDANAVRAGANNGRDGKVKDDTAAQKLEAILAELKRIRVE